MRTSRNGNVNGNGNGNGNGIGNGTTPGARWQDVPRGPWAPDAPLDAELLVQRCHDSVSVAHLAGQAADLFAGLPRGKAARLTETLEALLASRHRTATEVATALGIHAQTARYRLRQLDLILGDRLDDPQFRLRIQLSLRADRLRRGFPGQSSQ